MLFFVFFFVHSMCYNSLFNNVRVFKKKKKQCVISIFFSPFVCVFFLCVFFFKNW